MKNAMDWIKNNPITVGSLVVIVACVAYVFVFVGGQASNLLSESERQATHTRTIRGLMTTSVSVPTARPGEPEQTRQIVVNDAAIQEMERFYNAVRSEAERAEQWLSDRNAVGHELLVEGIFPGPRFPDRLRADFRDTYRRTFVRMLSRPAEDAREPRLNAGRPPSMDEISEVLAQIAEEFAPSDLRLGGQDDRDQRLADQRAEQLRTAQSDALREMLQRAAQHIHIYAAVPESEQVVEFAADFPFTVGAWSRPGGALEEFRIEELWDSQMSLWIQQDIVRAIALANRVSDSSANVISVPIKRLIRIDVSPEHRGVTAARRWTSDQRTRVTGATGRGGAARPPTGSMMGMEPSGYSGYSDAGGVDQQPLDPNQPMPPSFTISPTGRRSNPLYDVRWAEVEMVVDARQLPEIFQAFHSVNFMTIVDLEMESVDAYEAMLDGYLYTGDPMRITMTVESVWLRDWTSELMPPNYRIWLGIDEDPDAVPSTGGGGYDYEMDDEF